MPIGREVPWTRILDFHMEVTRRAEEAFFALPAKATNSNRWTSLNGFDLPTFAGPWRIPEQILSSTEFRSALRRGDVETLFLGGPCWFGWKRGDRKGWVLEWKPILYREIRLRGAQDGDLIFDPSQGKWEFSPLVYQFLDRIGVAPERPLDEWLPELLEETGRSVAPGRDARQAFLDVLMRYIPELADELAKELPPKDGPPPSDWVMFGPPSGSGTSVFYRHLMSDFRRLRDIFEEAPDNRGGFTLLEGLAVAERSGEVDLLPIVALNDSQMRAVTGVLEGRPVTVISGPPGTGKSQVVVSTLLNAWASGMSVLFTSNNNQAVDVVKSRVEKFEDEFPIAIRAGSRKASNLEEALRRTFNVLTTNGGASSSHLPSRVDATKANLTRDRDRLREALESKLPQRIDESWRSALNAHGEFQRAIAQLEEEESQVRSALRTLGYQVAAEEFSNVVLGPYQAWLDEVDAYKSQVVAAEAKRSEILAITTAAAAARDQAAAAVGLDATKVARWDWLSGTGVPVRLRDWLSEAESTLGEPLEEVLITPEWSAEFDQWASSRHAVEWGDEVQRVASAIRSACDEFDEDERAISAAAESLGRQSVRMRELGIPEKDYDRDLLQEWMDLYSESCGLPASRMSWLPWTRQSAVLRSMKAVEGKLRSAFPPSVWARIGRLSEGTRAQLASTVEGASQWCVASSAWHGWAETRSKMRSTYARLLDSARALGLPDLPGAEASGKEWMGFAATLAPRLETSSRAAAAWRRREERRDVQKRLADLAKRLAAIGAGTPLREAWGRGLGAKFEQSFRALLQDPGPSEFAAARAALYSEPIGGLLTAWAEADRRQLEADSANANLAQVPTPRDIIASWWARKPQSIALPPHSELTLPDGASPPENHLVACREWNDTWAAFIAVRRPELRRRVAEERTWALEKLSTAVENVPPGDSRRHLEDLLAKLTDSPAMAWPEQELEDHFRQLNPERIRAQIESIDQRLQSLSFDLAKEKWIQKLREDPETQGDLDLLLKRYQANHGQLREADYPLFARVLRALPIWITTALSPQALPLVPGLFDVIVIDEATQCTMTNLLPLVYRAKRLVVIGDPEQLPAIPVLTPGAEQALAATFEVEEWMDLLGHSQQNVYAAGVQCLPRLHSDVISLVEHYRSHPLIIGFANQHVYRKRLKLIKEPVSASGLPFGSSVFGVNTAGEAKRGDRGRSWFNPSEADAVVRLVSELKANDRSAHLEIGVVSPFRAQVDEIQARLEKSGLGTGVAVGTAHRFQGDERDIVVFSPVVATGMSDSAAKWVESPPNLVNVAVTRARDALFVVAEYASCRRQPGILGSLIRYVDDVTKLRETSMEELELFSWMVVQGWSPEVHPLVKDIEVDFILRYPGVRVAIEVDGDQHHDRTTEDAARDSFLRGQGFEVFRTSARAVRETPASVIQSIGKLIHSGS